MLQHSAAINALGYVCSARPHRRFVVLSRRHGFVFVAESHLVTVFALSPEASSTVLASPSPMNTSHGPRDEQDASTGDKDLQQPGCDRTMGPRPPQQVFQIPEDVGELIGLTIVDSADPDALASTDDTRSSHHGSTGLVPSTAPTMLLLGSAGVSAVQLRPPIPGEQEAPAIPTSTAESAAAAQSEEMKDLRLRALELLAGDGEW